MTGRPGACLAVSGPGVIHAIAGLANAWVRVPRCRFPVLRNSQAPQSNCWPMVLIGGASDVAQDGMGAFQETRQIEACRPFVKYAARPSSVARIPFFVEQAVRMSMYGRPGATYIDMPGALALSVARNCAHVHSACHVRQQAISFVQRRIRTRLLSQACAPRPQ